METKMREKSDEILYLNEWKFWTIFLFVCAFIFAYPFYSTEYLSHSDTFFHMNRIEGIKESLLGGEFPVRVHGFQLNGYGTLDGAMYPQLFLYFPAILRILGISVAVSWNIFWIFLIILGLFTSFVGFSIWAQNLRKGAVAALFFQVTNMGFFCLGHAVGDYPALFSLPLVFGTLLKIVEDEKYAKYWPLFVVAFTLIFENHIINTIIISMFILGILFFNFKVFKNKIQRFTILKSALFCILLNINFAIPFVYFYKTIFFHINEAIPPSLSVMTLNLKEIIISQFYLGIPLLLLLILFLILKQTRKNRGFIISILFYGFILFMLNEKFPWGWLETNLPHGEFLKKFQFPIRFVPFGLIFVIYYLGYFFSNIFENHKKYALGISVFFVFIISILVHPYFPSYFAAHRLADKTEYKTLEMLPSHRTDDIYLQEDYLYSDVNFYQLRNQNNDFYNSNDYKTDAKLFDKKKQGVSLEFSYNANKDTKIQVPLFYWKGYVAKDETGNNLELNFGENRFMEVGVQQGEHKIKIYYSGLTIFKIFDIISLVSLIIFCVILKRKYFKGNL